MLVGRDLGVSSLVLVVCLLFPVIGLVIRRQWRVAEARKLEIKRLMILASEEAARAELEANVGYSPVSVPNGYNCAVCFCPTTTRCSRCKSVRYCSGKCQIIHWRQGHKHECSPATVTWNLDDDKSGSGKNMVEEDRGNLKEFKCQSDEIFHRKPVPLPASKKLSDSANSVKEFHGNAVGIEADSVADKDEAVSSSEASGSSFSGFSSSAPSNESSDDSSICESVSSLVSDNSESHLSVETAADTLETDLSTNDVAPPSLSPKFTLLVESAENFVNLRKVDPAELNRESSSFSSLNESDRHGVSADDSCWISSDSWGKNVESKLGVTDCLKKSPLLMSNEFSRNPLDSASSLNFSFTSREAGSKNAQINELIDTPVGIEKSMNAVVTSGIGVNNGFEDSTKQESCFGISQDKISCRSSESNDTEARISLERPSVGGGIKDVPTKKNSMCSVKKIFPEADRLSKSGGLSRMENDDKHLSFYGLDADMPSGAHGFSMSTVKSERNGGGRLNAPAVPSRTRSLLNGRNSMRTSVHKVVDQLKGTKLMRHHTVANVHEISKSYREKFHFSYEVFSKLYHCKTDLQPCGLINCGNSCYANVVLQCLAFTRPLTAYFLQGCHSKACVRTGWCFTCEFEKLILKSSMTKSAIAPVGILSQLRSLGCKFGNGKQEDAHEFLRFVVDVMQTICFKEYGFDASCFGEKDKTTLISLTFGGYLRSKIKCMRCHGKSERHERMMDLAVEIDGDVRTLEEAIRRFTRTEILDAENKYKCERCKSYERAKKKLKILEAPNILTIALKRFQCGKFGKLNKSIRFPETLDLSPFVSGKHDNHIYELYGVIVHLDIMNASFSGHYVCYVKNSQNRWFKADDSMVTNSDIGSVLTKDAYMLLYARRYSRAPRSMSRGNATCDPKSKALASSKSSKDLRNHSRPPTDPAESQASIELFYSKFHHLQRILEEDSLSESSSHFSNSDEGSCTTDSTSTSTDEFADFIFGDLRRGLKHPSESEPSSSTSSSPSHLRHSPLSETGRYASTFGTFRNGLDSEKKGNKTNPFLDSDRSKHSRILDGSNRSSSGYRETNLQRIGLVEGDGKGEQSLRKAKGDRTG